MDLEGRIGGPALDLGYGGVADEPVECECVDEHGERDEDKESTHNYYDRCLQLRVP
jgi:hypothetical protein